MLPFRLISLIFLVQLSYLVSTSSSTYKAAVFEYHPIPHNDKITYEELCELNAQKYIDFIENSKTDIDIAVFPEATITTLTAFDHRNNLILIAVKIPKIHEEEFSNPCDAGDFPIYIKNISCAARRTKTYLVINTVEKIVCSEDEEREVEECKSEWNLYNVNMVFNRNGDIIARYRKYNLFNEPQNCRTKTPELVTFDTDFGVKFGTFVCFDILFNGPTMELVRQGIRHFVYPTWWFSEVPFLTANQAQAMFSIGNNVVLLASNANDPNIGSGGSGIYQGQNYDSEIIISPEGTTKMIVKEVEKNLNCNFMEKTNDSVEDIDRKGEEMERFHLSTDHHLKDFTSYEINGDINGDYCDGDFCCHFKVESKIDLNEENSVKYYRHRIMVFRGIRTFPRVKTIAGLEVCAIVFCSNDDPTSCGNRIKPYSEIEWPKIFNEISISVNNLNENTTYFPSTLLSSIEPLPITDYHFDDGTITLTNSQSRLLTFGIYGRDYSKDGIEESNEKEDSNNRNEL